MKKVVMTVIGVLAIAASASAQGTWYTNESLWKSLITNTISTANYDGSSVSENGVTTTSPGALSTSSGFLYGNTSEFITFTFSGNAFSTKANILNGSGEQVSSSILFNLDPFVYENLPTTASGDAFLGYISDSPANIVVRATPNSGTRLRINEFSFGNGTNSAGASVAPEPGSLALALTGGCALLGICIRRGRMSN